jgi:hypothetical protein
MAYFEHWPGRLAKHNAFPPSIVPLMPPKPQILVASEPLAVPELSSSKRPSTSETDKPSSSSKKSCTEETSGLSVCSLALNIAALTKVLN